MKLVRVLTIAGSDSCGGAGIQADLKTIMALGGLGMSAITALTAQNTSGIQDIYEIPPEFVEKQFASVMADTGVDAAKTGMLTNTAILRTVAGMIRRYGIEKGVVDPVMAAHVSGLRYDAGIVAPAGEDEGDVVVREQLHLVDAAPGSDVYLSRHLRTNAC